MTRDGSPAVGFHVFIDLAFGVPGLFGSGPELFWMNDRVEMKAAHVLTDE
jgi:hypothetical protein